MQTDRLDLELNDSENMNHINLVLEFFNHPKVVDLMGDPGIRTADDFKGLCVNWPLDPNVNNGYSEMFVYMERERFRNKKTIIGMGNLRQFYRLGTWGMDFFLIIGEKGIRLKSLWS